MTAKYGRAAENRQGTLVSLVSPAAPQRRIVWLPTATRQGQTTFVTATSSRFQPEQVYTPDEPTS